MSWMHKDPAPSPPAPPHVQLEALMGAIAQAESVGEATPATAFLRLACPKQQTDKWGQPLPLSDVDQDRTDRLFAIIADPYGRARALLRSGELMATEADAVKTAFPEVYTTLVTETLRDLTSAAPPFREWAETTVGVLLGMPPAILLHSATQEATPTPKLAKKPEPTPDMSGTAADRRDIGVRKELR